MCKPKLGLAILPRLFDDQADVQKQIPAAPTTTGFCNAGREAPSHNNDRSQTAIARGFPYKGEPPYKEDPPTNA